MGDVVSLEGRRPPAPKMRIALVDEDDTGGFLAVLQEKSEKASIVWAGFDYPEGIEVGRAKAKALGIFFVDFTNAPTNGGGNAA